MVATVTKAALDLGLSVSIEVITVIEALLTWKHPYVTIESSLCSKI